MGKKKSRYSREFRANAVALAMSSPKTIAEVARDLEMDDQTLRNWMKAEVPTPVGDPGAENAALRKRLAQVEEERDILKKAAAFFAAEEKKNGRK